MEPDHDPQVFLGKVTLYLVITTSAEVASGSTITNIIHFATTRSQVAAEAAEGAWTPNNQDPPRADEAAHFSQQDHACLTKALQQSLLNYQGWSTNSSFELLATEAATAAQLTVDCATLGTADHDADAPWAPPGSTNGLTLPLGLGPNPRVKPQQVQPGAHESITARQQKQQQKQQKQQPPHLLHAYLLVWGRDGDGTRPDWVVI